MTKLIILFLSLFLYLVSSDGQTLGSDNCCAITTPQHFSSTLRRNDGNVLIIRNSREILPNYYGNFYTGSSSNSGNLNFGVVDTDQNQNYGTFGQTQTQQQYQIPQQSQQNFNGFAQYGTGNGFDANTWAQTNANLFQQQQQANGYGIQQNNFGSQTNVGGGYGHIYGQATSQNYGQTQTQNQNYGQSQIQNQNYNGGLPQQTVQTFYPYSSTEQQQLPQQVQQPYQPVVDPFIQQSYVAPEVAPQTQASQYGNNFPQSSYSAPAPAQVVSEPEPMTVQPTIDLAQLQQYAQYLEQIQKQYGIKLPSTQSGASAPQNQVEIHTSQNPYASAIHPQIQTHVDIQNHQNPYVAAVQPQTQTHIQGTLNPVVQGTYSVPAGGSQGANNFNSWQNGFNSNYNQQIQAPSRPMNMISPSDSVYQAPQPAPAPAPAPAPVQQPYFPDYSNSNTVIDQSQPAPHIILPEPRQVIQPQPQPIVHVQQPVPQSQSIVHIQQPQPQPLPTIHIQQPSPVQSQSVYIPPTQATTLPPTRPSPMTQEYEYTTQQPQQPSRPISTTSIQALTQQIRKLPAVLYVDSRNSDTKRLETLLRENYGLPLVAFYVDKIDKPKTVERHLQQLTAHKGMPYLFICGTFIGSQQHIDNYHNNKQIPQLVEYVCGDEKKRKTQKRKKSSASTL